MAALRSPSPAVALLLTVLLAGLALPAAAQWKWRDKDGRITVSDLPPPLDVPQADILQQPKGRPTTPAPAPKPAASAASGSLPGDPALQARREAADRQREAAARR